MDTKHIVLLGLDATFVGAIALASQHGVQFDAKMMIPLALATFRMARTISFNEIFEPIRKPFTVVLPDSCGAGSDVHPKGEGLQAAIGGLLSCPICTGTWSALVLFTLWAFLPSFGHYLVYVLAIAGASELLHYLAGLAEWGGRVARVASGKISPDRN